MARKARHDSDLPRTSPAVVPPQYGTQDPNTANPSRTSPAVAPPQHGTQGPPTANLPRRQHVAQDPATTPPPTRYAKWSSGGNGGGGGQRDDGGEDGSDMRHSYYLRLYIFYLCNKLILFLYFVRLKL